eukprot:COSAG01_NODE_3416_length_6122_cov_11.318114_8_plen_74_part_00
MHVVAALAHVCKVILGTFIVSEKSVKSTPSRRVLPLVVTQVPAVNRTREARSWQGRPEVGCTRAERPHHLPIA